MKRFAALPAMLAVAACSTAAEWQPVLPADVAGLPDYALRADRPDFHLSATADYDGDGRPDCAELRHHARQHRYALFVHLADGHELLLAEGDAAELPRIGVANVPGGRYRPLCREKAKRENCLADLTLSNTGIALFTFESASRVFYWTAGAFASAWMSD